MFLPSGEVQAASAAEAGAAALAARAAGAAPRACGERGSRIPRQRVARRRTRSASDDCVRWARFPPDTAVDEELRLAERAATREAVAAIPALAAELAVDDETRDCLVGDYRDHLELVDLIPEGEDSVQRLQRWQRYIRLRLAVLDRKRDVILQLRDSAVIDDIVLRLLALTRRCPFRRRAVPVAAGR